MLLEFDQPQPLPPVVFVESLTNQMYQERKADIDRYREAVEYLRDAALSPRDSVLRLAAMREVYGGEAWTSESNDELSLGGGKDG